MKLDPKLVGKTLKGLAREVTWRQTTNYAAAVGDANPRYLDDTRHGGIVAPPIFAATSRRFSRSRIGSRKRTVSASARRSAHAWKSAGARPTR